WVRMDGLVAASQLEQSRQLAAIWDRLDDAAPHDGAEPGHEPGAPRETEPGPREHAGITAERLTLEQARARAEDDRALRRILRRYDRSGAGAELQTERWSGGAREYRYIRVLAPRDPPHRHAPPREPPGEPADGVGAAEAGDAGGAGEQAAPPEVISLTRRSAGAAGLLLVNAIYLFTAGAVVLAVAVGAF